MSARKPTEIISTTLADENHAVVSMKSDTKAYRKEPCGGCPWKTENEGMFPAEAFRISARTAYDMSCNTFACHESGTNHPATCAGFLVKGSDNNLAVRLNFSSGVLKNDFHDGGHHLHESYRDMAEANGVDPDDPVLAPCR